jgi:hypothetical protein
VALDMVQCPRIYKRNTRPEEEREKAHQQTKHPERLPIPEPEQGKYRGTHEMYQEAGKFPLAERVAYDPPYKGSENANPCGDGE